MRRFKTGTWKALVGVWEWAGRVDNYRGRLGVLLALIVLIVGGGLVLLRALGVVNTLLAVVGVAAILVGPFFLSAFIAHRPDRGNEEPFPDHGIELRTAWHFTDPDLSAIGIDFVVVELRITNKEPELTMNLNAEMFLYPVRHGQELARHQLLLVRSQRLPTQLQFPLEIKPHSTVTGSIVAHADPVFFNFDEMMGIVPKWPESRTVLALEEYVTSAKLEQQVPMATFRPEVTSQLVLTKPRSTLFVTYGQQAFRMRITDEESGSHIGSFFWIHNVSITNCTETKVSLDPVLVLRLDDGRSISVKQMGFSLVPSYFTRADHLLHGPLVIDPGDTASGDIGFTLMKSQEVDFFGERDYGEAALVQHDGLLVAELVLRDRVTGQETVTDVTTSPRVAAVADDGTSSEPPGD